MRTFTATRALSRRLPTKTAFSKLDTAGQATLATQLESLWVEHNTASEGTTAVEGEYLEVRAIRA